MHAPAARRDPIQWLLGAERVIFLIVGVSFFIAALALVLRATNQLWLLVAGPQAEILGTATTFLNMMLLVLMMVELAYTVVLSLRGAVLVAEPFLLVGLIAVIRRVIVITIGDVNPAPGTHDVSSGAAGQPVELGILTAIILVLVVSIAVLRRQPREESASS